MDDKITIIEGPTPTFEVMDLDPILGVNGWTSSLNESPAFYETLRTSLRTFNGKTLLERCENTWLDKGTMYLEYRDPIGLARQLPILACRTTTTEEGDVLVLWVRRDPLDEDIDLDTFDDASDLLGDDDFYDN